MQRNPHISEFKVDESAQSKLVHKPNYPSMPKSQNARGPPRKTTNASQSNSFDLLETSEIKEQRMIEK